jgi:hypothetical protein
MVNPFRLLQEAGSCTPFGLRELTFLEEQYQRPWAKDLKHVLLEMKAATDASRTQSLPHLATAQRLAFVARYQELLAAGHAAHPPPERRPKQRGRMKLTPAQNLLERLWLGQGQVLAFLHDLATSRIRSITIKPNATCACSRSSGKSRARSAPRAARGRSRAAAATWPA